MIKLHTLAEFSRWRDVKCLYVGIPNLHFHLLNVGRIDCIVVLEVLLQYDVILALAGVGLVSLRSEVPFTTLSFHYMLTS